MTSTCLLHDSKLYAPAVICCACVLTLNLIIQELLFDTPSKFRIFSGRDGRESRKFMDGLEFSGF